MSKKYTIDLSSKNIRKNLKRMFPRLTEIYSPQEVLGIIVAYSEFEDILKNSIYVGNVGIMPYLLPKFRVKVSSSYDQDLAYKGELRHKNMRITPLVDRQKIVYLTGSNIRRETELSKFKVKKVFFDKEIIAKSLGFILYNLDVFDFSTGIGCIGLTQSDFSKYKIVEDKDIEVKIARLGLLIATFINPYAITKERIKRIYYGMLSYFTLNGKNEYIYKKTSTKANKKALWEIIREQLIEKIYI